MKIAVTGATGFVGLHLCEHLVRQGHQVIALSRQGDGPTGTESHKADVVSGEGLHKGFASAEAVMHLVGIIREKGQEATFEKVHIEGTRQVLAACQATGVKRYIHMSALGAQKGTESAYFETKAIAEELVQEAELDTTIMKPSLIFGLNDDFFGGVLHDLVTSAPFIPQIGDGHFPFRPVWVGDVARAFEQALSQDSSIGESYDLVGPKEYSFRDLLKLMRQTLGLNKAILPVPLLLMHLAVPMLQVLPNPPITKDQFIMLLAGNTAAADKMQAHFDLTMTALEDRLAEILKK